MIAIMVCIDPNINSLVQLPVTIYALGRTTKKKRTTSLYRHESSIYVFVEEDLHLRYAIDM